MPAPRKRAGTPADAQAVPRYEDCWAKTTKHNRPGISVRDHCLNVGCVAEALLALLPEQLRHLLPTAAATLAAAHDVGKVSPGFQQKSEAWLMRHALRDQALKDGWNVCEPDHARISQFTVQQMLGTSQLHPWAAAVGAHHGRIKGERVRVREPWEQERRRLVEELIKEFGPMPDQPPNPASLWFLAGLITVADWIGSDEQHFPQDARWEMTGRRKRAHSALGRINWESAAVRQLGGFAELFPETPQANSLQTAAMQAVREPGIYIIEGPMGCGKTEAALAAAYQLIAEGKATGLYFALPTQVTSNRIDLRVKPFVERISANASSVRLAHGTSRLVDNEPLPMLRATSSDPEAQADVRAGRSWFASPKRALLTPYGVGTIDQALLGIVAANHFFVRRFGLAGKVVILDEVHSYDLYTGTLIDVLVKDLRELKSTVIVLSGTLTESRRRQILQAGEKRSLSDAYPLLSGIAETKIEIPCDPSPPKTVRIRCTTGETLVEDCMDRAEAGQCVLWIRNTVDDAQETYCALKGSTHEGGPEIALLHSRFPFFRREHLEADWMTRLGKDADDRPDGCVLVSTQVAEQSVDIDADMLITDLAPTDMLLQRMGRLWRHDRGRPVGCNPEIWIQSLPLSDDQVTQATKEELRQALGKSARVYAPYVLLRSLEQRRGREAITLPADIRDILEATYAESGAPDPTGWWQLHDELEQRKRKLADQALSSTRIWVQPALPDEEGAQTRFSSYQMAHLLLARSIESVDTHTIRLQLLEGEAVEASDRGWNFSAARAIYRNLTRVPRWAVSTALLKPPGWLTNHVSQSTAVGLLRPDGGITLLGSDAETGLSYYADQGIVINRKRMPRAGQEEFDESYD